LYELSMNALQIQVCRNHAIVITYSVYALSRHKAQEQGNELSVLLIQYVRNFNILIKMVPTLLYAQIIRFALRDVIPHTSSHEIIDNSVICKVVCIVLVAYQTMAREWLLHLRYLLSM
jgi:hypothetical protein